MIVYRINQSNHHVLARMFWATMWLELIGTLVETVIVMWLFGSLWSHWSLSLKVVTPILHVLFSCAQLWGAWIFRQMAIQQEQLITGEKEEESGRPETRECF